MKLWNRLFQKRERSNDSTETVSPFKTSIEKGKIKLAKFLSLHYEALSQTNKRLSLIFIGLLMGGLSLSLIVSPLGKMAPNLFPKAAIQKQVITQSETAPITKQEYELLLGYRKTLDSLKRFDPVNYRFLLKGRNGLLDSLDFLIRFYEQKNF